MNETTTAILDKTAVLSLNIRLWSGRRVLEAQDVGLAETEIPDIVNLGSKKVFDPDKLSQFPALKRKAERFCLANGVKFLNAYAIPIDRLDALTAKLDALKDEFLIQLTEFLAEYDNAVTEWASKHPSLAESIKRYAPDEAYLKSHISFGYHVFSIAPAAPAQKYEENLEEQVAGLTGQLRKEVRDAARLLWKTSLNPDKGDMVSHKVLNPIFNIIDKMEGLSYLDNQIAQDVEFHKSMLTGFPDHGPISGQHLTRIRSSVLLLSEMTLKAHEPVAEDMETETAPVPETETYTGAQEPGPGQSASPDAWF